MKQRRTILQLAMVVGMMLLMSITAMAWDGDPYAGLVNTTTTVKFNNIGWYVIADNSTAVDAGTVTLLAKDPIGASKFHDSRNVYSSSTAKGYLDELMETVLDACEHTELITLADASQAELFESCGFRRSKALADKQG